MGARLKTQKRSDKKPIDIIIACCCCRCCCSCCCYCCCCWYSDSANSFIMCFNFRCFCIWISLHRQTAPPTRWPPTPPPLSGHASTFACKKCHSCVLGLRLGVEVSWSRWWARQEQARILSRSRSCARSLFGSRALLMALSLSWHSRTLDEWRKDVPNLPFVEFCSSTINVRVCSLLCVCVCVSERVL